MPSPSSSGSSGQALYTIHAHDKAVCSISYSSHVPNVIVTPFLLSTGAFSCLFRPDLLFFFFRFCYNVVVLLQFFATTSTDKTVQPHRVTAFRFCRCLISFQGCEGEVRSAGQTMGYNRQQTKLHSFNKPESGRFLIVSCAFVLSTRRGHIRTSPIVTWFYCQGAVFTSSFCNDAPFLLAVGGSKGNLHVSASNLCKPR